MAPRLLRRRLRLLLAMTVEVALRTPRNDSSNASLSFTDGGEACGEEVTMTLFPQHDNLSP